MFLFGALAILTACAYANPVPSGPERQLCNGNADFCDRKFSNVTWIGTHNSPFDRGGMTGNQQKNVTEQLDAGIRFLQAQAFLLEAGSKDDNDFRRRDSTAGEGELHLCHSWCGILDAGSLTNYLSTIKAWLDKHQNEVVILLLTNQEGAPISKFASAFEDSKLKDYAFSPPEDTLEGGIALEAWPTYGELIKDNKRLVVFLDRIEGGSVPYILNEWTYYFETPFSITDPAKFEECPIDRLKNLRNGDGRMYIINHSLNKDNGGLFSAITPDHDAAAVANAATGVSSIGAHADVCLKTHGRRPNVILVDDFHIGHVFEAQNALNGV